MYLVSRLKTSVALLFVLVLVSTIVLFATPEKAEATTLSSGRSLTYFSASTFGAMPAEYPASLQAFGGVRPVSWWDSIASLGNNIACFNAIGAALSATTGVCDDSVMGSVVEKIEEALDCVKEPMDCITKYIFDVLGGAVGWAVNGVVTLVTGTNAECIRPGDESPTFNDDARARETLDQRLAGFDSSGAWTAAQDFRCSERISLDYFGPGAGETQDIFAAINDARATELRQIRQQMSDLSQQGITSGEEYEALVARQALLNETAGDVSEADAITRGQAVNSVFWTPKSTVSTETFKREYGKYVLISVMIMVPMIIAAALQSLITGKAALMMRGVFIHMPVAIFGMIIAPYLVRTLMAITDTFSSFIIADVSNDVQGFFTNSSELMTGLFISMGVYVLLPAFLIVLVFLFASLMVWFILNVREASISLVAVFLPIALAASIWPALGSWAIKAIKLLVASIISKIFIVGAISLGIGIFTGGADTEGIAFSLSHLVYGSVIFLIAAFQPMLVLRFMDEIGDSMTNEGKSGGFAKGVAIGNGLQALTGKTPLGGLLGKGGSAASSLASPSGASPTSGTGSAPGGSSGGPAKLSPAAKAAVNAATSPKGTGGGTSPGGGNSSPKGGNTSPGGTNGGSTPLPAGANGGHDISGQRNSGLLVPSSMSENSGGGGDSGGYPDGSSSNFNTGEYQAPGQASAPDLGQISANLANFSGGGGGGAPTSTTGGGNVGATAPRKGLINRGLTRAAKDGGKAGVLGAMARLTMGDPRNQQQGA